MKKVFWYLTSPTSTHKLASWDETMEIIPFNCPATFGMKQHILSYKRNHNLSILVPSYPLDDCIWTWYSEWLLQSHVLQEFRKHKITGFESKPVKAKYKNRKNVEIDGINEVVVTGWGGIPDEQSGMRQIGEPCGGCSLVQYSNITCPEQLVNEKHWDGSDIFIIYPFMKQIFITDKLAELIRSYKWSGVRLLPFSEFPYLTQLCGVRLRYTNLPDTRAHEIGDPLDIY